MEAYNWILVARGWSYWAMFWASCIKKKTNRKAINWLSFQTGSFSVHSFGYRAKQVTEFAKGECRRWPPLFTTVVSAKLITCEKQHQRVNHQALVVSAARLADSSWTGEGVSWWEKRNLNTNGMSCSGLGAGCKLYLQQASMIYYCLDSNMFEVV